MDQIRSSPQYAHNQSVKEKKSQILVVAQWDCLNADKESQTMATKRFLEPNRMFDYIHKLADTETYDEHQSDKNSGVAPRLKKRTWWHIINSD